MSDPLDGRSVVITRSASQNASLRMLLEARGAVVIEVPLIAIEEPEDEGRERDAVLQQVVDFDWVVVTSPNGAERVAPFVSAALAAADHDHFPRFAAVGAATADSLRTHVDLVAEPARASVLAEEFPRGNGSVLVVQGNLADDDLALAIGAKGWDVTRVVAYRTVHLRPTPGMMQAALDADALLLASGSAASAWVDAFGVAAPPVVVSIGPSTTGVAESLGITVSATAPGQSLEALIEAAANSIGA
jgi:uroporphyrinogen-III synthase